MLGNAGVFHNLANGGCHATGGTGTLARPCGKIAEGIRLPWAFQRRVDGRGRPSPQSGENHFAITENIDVYTDGETLYIGPKTKNLLFSLKSLNRNYKIYVYE